MALVIVFLFYDVIVSMNSPPSSQSNPSQNQGIDISTVIIQIIVIVVISSVVLLVAIKWKGKKIKESKNNCNFNRLMKSRKKC